jgi:hypothetical protein
MQWLFEGNPNPAILRHNLSKLEIEELEDGTYIVY